MILNGNKYNKVNGYSQKLLSQTQAITTRAMNEGFALPNDKVIYSIDQHIRDLVNIGIWDNADLYFNFAYNTTGLQDFSRINWKNPFGVLMSPMGGLIYTISGWEGNSLDGYIDTQYLVTSGNNYSYNSAAFGGTIYKIQVGGNTTAGRLCSTLTQELITITTTGTGIRSRIQSVNNLSIGPVFTGRGWKSLSKSVAGSRDTVNKDVAQNIIVSESIPDTNGLKIVLLASPANPVYSNNGISNYVLGSAISNIQTQQIRTSYNKYLTAIGLEAYS